MGTGPSGAATSTLEDKQQILAASSIHGGLVIHLGCTDAGLLVDFAQDSRFVTQALVREAEVLSRLREALAAEDLIGRASVRLVNKPRLPYVDYSVRFLIVEDALDVPESELMRVLCPGGVFARKSSTGWSTTVKPWPETMDEWTHVRHGADGNLVSRDELVGAPTNVRWIADAPPTTSMSQNVVIVSSGGRLLTVSGDRPPVIFARDAFSGTVLWKRTYDLPPRRFSHRAFWERPPLIAVGNRVYIAGAAIDAVTGEPAFTFEGNPVGCESGVLLTSNMRALDAETGKQLWQHPERAAASVIADANICFVAGTWPKTGGAIELVSLDLKTGKERWRNKFEVPPPATKADAYDGYAPSTTPNGLLVGMVYHNDVLALEVSRTYIHLFSATDGRHIRSLRYKNWSPYAAGLRALMIDNQLWLPEYERGEKFDYGLTINAYNLTDGKKNKSLKLSSPIRQRCRPPLASGQFMYLGGMNSVDLSNGDSRSMPIARSACGIGVVPANGLIYIPPTHCRCYAMIPGYVALESRQQMGYSLAEANPTDHLVRGSAYDWLGKREVASQLASVAISNDDWPAFRQDFMRQGRVEAALPSTMKLQWSYQVPSARLSSPVATGSIVLVADTGRHRIDAVNAATGKRKWSFVADAAISGSPTIVGRICLVGCRDGWIYAIRLKDGALVWRNLAAPEERQIVAFGQLESAWPALGPVTVSGGTVCAVAGRHNMAEGGILVTGFDLGTGKKLWQTAAPHQPLSNGLTGGAYEPKSTKPDPRPTSAALGGWLVSDGSTVQVDRLGAFDVKTGQTRDLFDARLDRPYKSGIRPLKNGAKRSDPKLWLLAAGDGNSSCRGIGQELAMTQNKTTKRFRTPSDVRSVASAGDAWVVLTDNQLLLVDKTTHVTRVACEFQGVASMHGLGIASSRVFITTQEGRLLCFADSSPEAKSNREAN
jgi:outer membrane protein assembly factor BamB